MNDKELLEFAAKAAELAVCDEACHDDDGLFLGNGDGDLFRWNPLTDDGDALRLAVKLKIDIVFDFDRAIAVYGDSYSQEEEYFYDWPKPTDKNAATRRAIVRAAAEIGKSL